MNSIQISHDCCFGTYILREIAQLTLTYFNVIGVKLWLTIRVCAIFHLNYCMNSIQTFHDWCFGPYTLRERHSWPWPIFKLTRVKLWPDFFTSHIAWIQFKFTWLFLWTIYTRGTDTADLDLLSRSQWSNPSGSYLWVYLQTPSLILQIGSWRTDIVNHIRLSCCWPWIWHLTYFLRSNWETFVF